MKSIKAHIQEASKLLSKKHKCACDICSAAYLLKHGEGLDLTTEQREALQYLANKAKGN